MRLADVLQIGRPTREDLLVAETDGLPPVARRLGWSQRRAGSRATPTEQSGRSGAPPSSVADGDLLRRYFRPEFAWQTRERSEHAG
jgi:hypothetical protein